MLGNSFELRHEMVEDRRSHVLSNSVEGLLLRAKHGSIDSGSGAAAPVIRRGFGRLVEYEELQLSPLERERFDGKGRRPTIGSRFGLRCRRWAAVTGVRQVKKHEM